MMAELRFDCDRCSMPVQGIEYEAGTIGFYYVGLDVLRGESLWHRYAREGEERICEGCMWRDEGYLADHPHMRGVQQERLL